MAQSGGGNFGAFLFGVVVGVAGAYYGPGLYQKYVRQAPETVRIEMQGDRKPGVWRRSARFDIEFSAKRADGKDWDWPMTEPEVQLCIRDGAEYRRCLGPRDPAIASCQGRFSCTTGPISVPEVPFTFELYEWDDYNAPDLIGSIDCDIGQTCTFTLGKVSVRAN
jgi:hypothetical protein